MRLAARCAATLGVALANLNILSAAVPPHFMKISPRNPFYYLTSVTNHRLPVFRLDEIKDVVCIALDEARRSSGILIFAYVIMPDHIHLICDSSRSITDTLRYFNGIVARRVIDHLKMNEHWESLAKLRVNSRSRNHSYSVWGDHPNSFAINNEVTLMQKVNYIHQNPVRAGFVNHPDDYLYSSSRIWNRRPKAVEPLEVDIDRIDWRSADDKRRSRR